jgi:predicted DCC family thiol-disulfide oxidoreductase YuxK
MKLPEQLRKIEVFYDGRCGMCCSFHEWINRQPRAYEIDFIPYQAARAEKVFPGIGTLDPARFARGIDQVAGAMELPRKPAVADLWTDKYLPPMAARTI